MSFFYFAVSMLCKISFKNVKVCIKYTHNFQYEIFGKKAKLARLGL